MLNLRMQLPQPKQKHSFLLWENPNRVNDPGGIIPLASYEGGGVSIIPHFNTYNLFFHTLITQLKHIRKYKTILKINTISYMLKVILISIILKILY